MEPASIVVEGKGGNGRQLGGRAGEGMYYLLEYPVNNCSPKCGEEKEEE